MNRESLRQPHILLIVVVILSLTIIAGIFWGIQAQRASAGYTIGKESIPPEKISAFEDHEYDLLIWKKQKVTRKIVLHIDQHDDLRFIPGNKTRQALQLLKKNNMHELESQIGRGRDSLFRGGDFLYLAYQAELIDEVYWLIPLQFNPSRKLEQAQSYLRSLKFPEEDVKDFILEDGLVTGEAYGVPLTLVTFQDKLSFDKPVLLDIDTDFFPNARRNYHMPSSLGIIKKLFDYLRANSVSTDLATIAYSTRYDYTPFYQRYLAEVVAQSLVHPNLIRAKSPPIMWGLLADGEVAILENRFDVAQQKFEAALTNELNNPFALYGLAFAQANQGNTTAALTNALKAAQNNPEFYYGLLTIGECLSQSGQFEQAKPFFLEVLKINPSAYAHRKFADALYNHKDYAGALRHYFDSDREATNISTLIYIGDTYFALNNPAKALQYYQKGLALMKDEPFEKLTSYPQGLLNLSLIYEQRKDYEKALHYLRLYEQTGPTPQEKKEITVRKRRLEKLNRQ